jgi:hypothetical protein
MILNVRTVEMNFIYKTQSYLTQKQKCSPELVFVKNVTEIYLLSVKISIDKPALLCYSIINNRRVYETITISGVGTKYWLWCD